MHRIIICMAMISVALGGGSLAAQDDISLGEDHNWARFGLGSWKLVRVYTESMNRQGQVEATSTQEIKLTLEKLDENRYTLKVEVTVDAAGKQFVAQPKFVQRGFHGETNGQTATVRRLGSAELQIGGQTIPTEIREVVVNGTDARRVARVFHSPDQPPYVLKQEITSTDEEGKIKNYEAVSEVVALAMPYKVLSQIKTSAYLKTVQQTPAGQRTVTLEVVCPEVPGGVVAHSAKSLDGTGRIVQRTTLELLDYEALIKAPVEEMAGGL